MEHFLVKSFIAFIWTTIWMCPNISIQMYAEDTAVYRSCKIYFVVAENTPKFEQSICMA